MSNNLSFRNPVANDGPAMHALVERCKPLDVNSLYCYLILCEHFSSTCLVVEDNNEVVGFITAYIPPEKRDTLFVWQVAVDARLRGQGIAKKMIRTLLSRSNLMRTSYIEGTVNPSNEASRSLFKSLAKDCSCAFDEDLIFPAKMFGEGDHEQENLMRVGPVIR
ncbi:MAG: diaminobutyrate acetyltransferase [Mariprofundus sp.]|nr:diaminobutyrate acetyltransferase [Mariprofundus sp.]